MTANDLTIKVAELTEDQARFFHEHCSYQEINPSEVLGLAGALAGVPYLRNVRLGFDGGPISGSRLYVAGDMNEDQLLGAIAELQGFDGREREARGYESAFQALKRLEKALGRESIFEGVRLSEVQPVVHPLREVEKALQALGEPTRNPEVSGHHYLVHTSTYLRRREGTEFKVDYLLPIKLHVKG